MKELIYRQAAIDLLRKRLIETANNNVGFKCDAGQVFEDASERIRYWIDELPSAQPATNCSEIPNASDFVSRKAVRDMVSAWAYDLMEQEDLNMALHDVDELPPAQPEVIHCKDCKHRDPEDKKCDSGHAIQWQLPRSDDWFCADAERKQK